MEQLAGFEDRRARIDERLETAVGAVESPPLRERMQRVVLSGGKRVRPLLTVLVCDALDGDADRALDYAAGIELVHAASLVVDDIVDRAEIRRGGPAAWAAFGHGQAIAASDGLIGEAFALFAAEDRATQAVAEAMVELGEGEATELVAPPDSAAEYRTLARRKTGALFRAAAELGAIAADADPFTTEAVGQYAERVGIAFQMRDDVLDAVADTEQLGKPAGRDTELERPSVLEVTGQSPAAVTALAREEAAAAVDALEAVELDPEAATYFEQLATFVAERDR